MSEAEIGRPEGRTEHSGVAEERYNRYRTDTGPLQAGDFVQLTQGYLREWVCMGQCNLYIAAAQSDALKELIGVYLQDVCDPNLAEMQKYLEDHGYTVPIPADQAPASTAPIQTDSIDDRTIVLGQWFAVRAFMELWHSGAMASINTDVRDAFIRNYHRANRWHIAYHDFASQNGYLDALPTIDPQRI